jgi:hypothetical protein
MITKISVRPGNERLSLILMRDIRIKIKKGKEGN